MFAVLDAAASRQEDAHSGMGPAIGFLVGAFILTGFASFKPGDLLARIGSFLPPLAPLTVPARMLLGDPPVWGPVVDIVCSAVVRGTGFPIMHGRS